MGRWLRGAMAERLGAWGGVDTPFLRGFLLGLAARAAGQVAPRGREDIDRLGFHIASALLVAERGSGPVPAAACEPVLAMVRRPGGGLDASALLRVSRSIAECFDRYEVDRPDLIEAWVAQRAYAPERASERFRLIEGWQRPLWQATARQLPTHAIWNRLRELVERLEGGVLPAGLHLPSFLSIFGVSLLPPSMLRALVALGRHTRVSLHLLTPTQAFVAERMERRRVLWQATEQGLDEASIRAAEMVPPGHPLLEAMGRQATEAQRVLADLDLLDGSELDPAPQGESLLQRVQAGLLADEPPMPQSLVEHDRSIRIHAAPGPMRCAEVLHDQLLAAFEEMPDLRPDQVAILTPDLKGVGHAIEAVFARHGRLPLSPADPALAQPSSLRCALQSCLDMALDGVGMDGLRQVLDQPAVQAALDLSSEDLEAWLDRLDEAGARRFADADDRAVRLGRERLADDRLHTIEWAIDRLVLGTALGTHSDAGLAVGGALPADLLPAQATGSAGLNELYRLVAMLEAIGRFDRAFAQSRPIEAWCTLVADLAVKLLPKPDHAEFGEARRRLDQALQDLADVSRDGGFTEPIDGVAAREQILQAIEDLREGTHFATGGITVARLAPMRSVPFRVLALVGLDLGRFPRASEPGTFDLAALLPRAGDRSRRHEDLQLFLECMHAATDRLLIVHDGVDARSGKPRPPSPVVDQLLDACVSHSRASADDVRARLVRMHPLRADQPESWRAPQEPGFDADARAGAEAAAQGRVQPVEPVFLEGLRLQPRSPDGAVALERAFKDPAKAFLERLGVQMPEVDRWLRAGAEPVELDGLDAWKLDQSAAQRLLAGGAVAVWIQEMRAQGLLPHGPVGEGIARERARMFEAARTALAGLVTQHAWPAAASMRLVQRDAIVALPVGDLPVRFDTLEGAGVQVLVQRSGARRDRPLHWIRHLFWSVAEPGCPSVLLVLDGTPLVFDAVDASKARAQLTRLFDIGAAGSVHALPIHPKVLEAWRHAKSAATRVSAIERVIEPSWNRSGSGLLERPAVALAHQGEAWGPGEAMITVGPGRAVPVGLDALASEIDAMMKEDGW